MTRLRGWRIATLGLLTGAFVVAAILVPAMPQPLDYHAFADARTLAGVANFFNVASNLPFLVAGAWGLAIVSGGGALEDPRERLPYLVFFAGALLTCFGSGWYHLAPDNTRLVWDRLPMTLGFSGLLAAALGERLGARLGLRALWVLLAAGVATVLFWHATEQAGRGNVVPYVAFQGWSVVTIVALMLLFPVTRYRDGRFLAWAAAWYTLAKVFETFDAQAYRLLGGTTSGHTVKHLLAAAAVFAIVWQLRLRRPLQAASIARA